MSHIPANSSVNNQSELASGERLIISERGIAWLVQLCENCELSILPCRCGELGCPQWKHRDGGHNCLDKDVEAARYWKLYRRVFGLPRK